VTRLPSFFLLRDELTFVPTYREERDIARLKKVIEIATASSCKFYPFARASLRTSSISPSFLSVQASPKLSRTTFVIPFSSLQTTPSLSSVSLRFLLQFSSEFDGKDGKCGTCSFCRTQVAAAFPTPPAHRNGPSIQQNKINAILALIKSRDDPR